MPTTNSVTCPECQTRFRVDAEQLALADGLLRCGVCGQVFNARSGARHDPDAASAETAQASAVEGDEVAADPQQVTQLDNADAESGVDTQPGSDTQSEANTQGDAEDAAAAPQTDDAPKNKAEVLLEGLSTVNHDFEHHQHHRRERRWPWLLLNLIALLVLAGQLAYWQRDVVLASPARDAMLTACEWLTLSCLPAAEQADRPATTPAKPSEVSSSKLLVRKHPQRDQALVVDTILVNQGERTVAFPQLLLRFSDINGREVASRLFQPEDYLHGELNALSELAPQQPVHIALEIADPGADAVNYELEIVAAP